MMEEEQEKDKEKDKEKGKDKEQGKEMEARKDVLSSTMSNTNLAVQESIEKAKAAIHQIKKTIVASTDMDVEDQDEKNNDEAGKKKKEKDDREDPNAKIEAERVTQIRSIEGQIEQLLDLYQQANEKLDSLIEAADSGNPMTEVERTRAIENLQLEIQKIESQFQKINIELSRLKEIKPIVQTVKLAKDSTETPKKKPKKPSLPDEKFEKWLQDNPTITALQVIKNYGKSAGQHINKLLSVKPELILALDPATQNSLLHIAVCKPSIVKILLNKKIEVNKLNLVRKTPLQTLIEKIVSKYASHDILLQSLILLLSDKRTNVHVTDQEGNTLLHVLFKDCRKVYHKDEINAFSVIRDFAVILAAFGARFDVKNKKGETPLDMCRQAEQSANQSPLRLNIELENPSIFMPFKIEGKGINVQGPNGISALMIAIKFRTKQCTSAVLKLGANPNLLDKMGRSALFYAISHTQTDKEMPYLKSLLRHQATVSVFDAEQSSFLHFAIKELTFHPSNNSLKTLKFILNKAHDLTLSKPNLAGETAFHCYMEQMVNYCFHNRLYISERAVSHFNRRYDLLLELAQEFLKRGCSWTALNQKGLSPMHVFYKSGLEKLAENLKEFTELKKSIDLKGSIEDFRNSKMAYRKAMGMLVNRSSVQRVLGFFDAEFQKLEAETAYLSPASFLPTFPQIKKICQELMQIRLQFFKELKTYYLEEDAWNKDKKRTFVKGFSRTSRRDAIKSREEEFEIEDSAEEYDELSGEEYENEGEHQEDPELEYTDEHEQIEPEREIEYLDLTGIKSAQKNETEPHAKKKEDPLKMPLNLHYCAVHTQGIPMEEYLKTKPPVPRPNFPMPPFQRPLSLPMPEMQSQPTAHYGTLSSSQTHASSFLPQYLSSAAPLRSYPGRQEFLPPESVPVAPQFQPTSFTLPMPPLPVPMPMLPPGLPFLHQPQTSGAPFLMQYPRATSPRFFDEEESQSITRKFS